jgi:hypothetical protein
MTKHLLGATCLVCGLFVHSAWAAPSYFDHLAAAHRSASRTAMTTKERCLLRAQTRRRIGHNETYNDAEIANRKNERIVAAAGAIGGGFVAVGGAALRNPRVSASGAAIAADQGREAYDAHQDIKEMEAHNERVRQNSTTS